MRSFLTLVVLTCLFPVPEGADPPPEVLLATWAKGIPERGYEIDRLSFGPARYLATLHSEVGTCYGLGDDRASAARCALAEWELRRVLTKRKE